MNFECVFKYEYLAIYIPYNMFYDIGQKLLMPQCPRILIFNSTRNHDSTMQPCRPTATLSTHFQNNRELYMIVVYEALFYHIHLVCGLEIAL